MSDTSHGYMRTRGSVIHWAHGYDLLTRLIGVGPRSTTRRALLDHAALAPGHAVLDVGCGPGALTLLAAERVGSTGEAHGLDPSPEMIRLATEKAAKASVAAAFREGVIESLPFPDASFDAVLSSLMLHHLPDDVKRAGFAEVARVLKPGGRFVALDLSGKGWMWRILSIVGHRLPERYGDELSAMVAATGLAPQPVDTEKKQYVTIVARKP